MNIVIAMAGESRRFRAAGYSQPKYMLPLAGKTLFYHAIISFAAFFSTAHFWFLARGGDETRAFIAASCQELGLRHYHIVLLEHPTRGQAETVSLGLAGKLAADAPLYIFNIDTFRPGWQKPAAFAPEQVDGYLEVFKGSGMNWSYVKPGDKARQTVLETAEKQPLSDLCCTGLYYFNRWDAFHSTAHQAAAAGQATWSEGELYIAPLYNRLIAANADIRYAVIPPEAVIFCGTPTEYDACRALMENALI